jgi:hypothetical protein
MKQFANFIFWMFEFAGRGIIAVAASKIISIEYPNLNLFWRLIIIITLIGFMIVPIFKEGDTDGNCRRTSKLS